MTAILSIIGSILAIIIGLWKFFDRKRQERKNAADKIDEGIKNNDPSDITSGFDRLRR